MTWTRRAACRDEDPELFFAVGTEGPALQQVEAAKKVCARCPVHTECLAWALEHGIDDGVFGGRTEAERRQIKRNYIRQRTA